MVEELQHEENLKKEDIEAEAMGLIDSSTKQLKMPNAPDNADVQSSHALFDNLNAKEDNELDDSVSSVSSSNSFR